MVWDPLNLYLRQLRSSPGQWSGLPSNGMSMQLGAIYRSIIVEIEAIHHKSFERRRFLAWRYLVDENLAAALINNVSANHEHQTFRAESDKGRNVSTYGIAKYPIDFRVIR
jgi:hypothetical protein